MDEDQIVEEIANVLERPSTSEKGKEFYRAFLTQKVCTKRNEGEAGVEYHEVLDGLYYDDTKGENLIRKAIDGDGDAKAVLFIVAAMLIDKGCSLPTNLGIYIAAFLWLHTDGIGAPEGAVKYRNFPRDHSILMALAYLAAEHGICDPRAIKLIHRALQKIGHHITEDGVRKVVMRKILGPDGLLLFDLTSA